MLRLVQTALAEQPKVPFTQKMSLNFVTRKLKTQKLEENNDNEDSPALNENEVRLNVNQRLIMNG